MKVMRTLIAFLLVGGGTLAENLAVVQDHKQSGSWSNLMKGFTAGGLTCDAIIAGMTHTVAREGTFQFTTGYFTNEWGVLGLKTQTTLKKKADLNKADVTILVQADTTHDAAGGTCADNADTKAKNKVCKLKMIHGNKKTSDGDYARPAARTGDELETDCEAKVGDDANTCAYSSGDFDKAKVQFLYGTCWNAAGEEVLKDEGLDDQGKKCGTDGHTWKQAKVVAKEMLLKDGVDAKTVFIQDAAHTAAVDVAEDTLDEFFTYPLHGEDKAENFAIAVRKKDEDTRSFCKPAAGGLTSDECTKRIETTKTKVVCEEEGDQTKCEFSQENSDSFLNALNKGLEQVWGDNNGDTYKTAWKKWIADDKFEFSWDTCNQNDDYAAAKCSVAPGNWDGTTGTCTAHFTCDVATSLTKETCCSENGGTWANDACDANSTATWAASTFTDAKGLPDSECAKRLTGGKRGHYKSACESNSDCTYTKGDLVDDSTGPIDYTEAGNTQTGRLKDIIAAKKITFCIDEFAPFRYPAPEKADGVKRYEGFDDFIAKAVSGKIATKYGFAGITATYVEVPATSTTTGTTGDGDGTGDGAADKASPASRYYALIATLLPLLLL